MYDWLKWVNPPAASLPDGIVHRTFYSKLVEQDVGYCIYLPPNYDTSNERYPVIYWLHGIGGSESKAPKNFKNLNKYVCKEKVPKVIVVFVNGGARSRYMDSPDGVVPAESLIIRELIPFIDEHYRTIAARNGRAIEGFSMGGGGALKLAFKYPEHFCSVQAYAAALPEGENINDADNHYTLFNSNIERIKGKLAVGMIVGSDDITLVNNIKMHKFLDSRGISHTYEVYDGLPHQAYMYYDVTGEEVFRLHTDTFDLNSRKFEGSFYEKYYSEIYEDVLENGFQITRGDPESSENGAEWEYLSCKGHVKYRIKGIIYKPKGKGPFPAVIVSHGKMGWDEDYSKIIAREMVNWGLVVIATNYAHGKEPDGSPGIPNVDMGAHTANLLRAHKCYDILAQLGYVDMNRVAAHGHSMGAFLTAALVGSYPNHFLVASQTAGGVNDKNYPPYTSSEQARGIKIPYQIHHGTADTIVPIESDRILDGILSDIGTVHELIEYEGKTHRGVKFDKEMFECVRAWYHKHGLF